MEDLVYAFKSSGGDVSVDLKALQAAAKTLALHLPGPLPSRLSRVAL
jgi:hypothetical protein